MSFGISIWDMFHQNSLCCASIPLNHLPPLAGGSRQEEVPWQVGSYCGIPKHLYDNWNSMWDRVAVAWFSAFAGFNTAQNLHCGRWQSLRFKCFDLPARGDIGPKGKRSAGIDGATNERSCTSRLGGQVSNRDSRCLNWFRLQHQGNVFTLFHMISHGISWKSINS